VALLEPGEPSHIWERAWARSRSWPPSRRRAWETGWKVAAPPEGRAARPADAGGLGNIYVDEALWYSRLHPQRPAGSLDRDELRRLHRAIRKALELGLARQGSTLTDYRLPDGSSGSMQKEFKAYGRDDEPCDRCGTPLAKTRVAGRGTWFCPSCQTLP
jgi:formamidopyrimidine-DNA glycosylase